MNFLKNKLYKCFVKKSLFNIKSININKKSVLIDFNKYNFTNNYNNKKDEQKSNFDFNVNFSKSKENINDNSDINEDKNYNLSSNYKKYTHLLHKVVNEKKEFYLIKNGQVGWVSAYVDQEINETAAN